MKASVQEKGPDSDTVLEQVQLAPTMLFLMGAEVPDTMLGWVFLTSGLGLIGMMFVLRNV